MNLPIRAAIASLTFLTLAAAAHAHNLWLLPSATVLSKPEWVTFDAAASTRVFESDHVALGLDTMVATGPDGTAIDPENSQRGKLRSVFDLNLTKPGTYRVALVNHGVLASYKDATGQSKRWRGKASDLALPAGATDVRIMETVSRVENFVTVGKPTRYGTVGKGLELVPETHPNDLARGERATFVLLLDGQPAAGFNVEATRGGLRFRDQVGEIKTTTDAEGRFSFTWPEAGLYYVETSTKDEKTTVAAAKERRVSYAATLEVLP